MRSAAASLRHAVEAERTECSGRVEADAVSKKQKGCWSKEPTPIICCKLHTKLMKLQIRSDQIREEDRQTERESLAQCPELAAR